MIKKTSNCVNCPQNIGCIGSSCPYFENYELICDKCNTAVDELYEVDNAELCEDCLRKEFNKITYDNLEEYIERESFSDRF